MLLNFQREFALPVGGRQAMKLGTVTLSKCAVHGCQRVKPGRTLMCMEHWRMVPEADKRKVRNAYGCWCSVCRGEVIHGVNQMDAVLTLRKAQDAAVAAVEHKLELRRAEAEGHGAGLFAAADNNTQQDKGMPGGNNGDGR